MPVAVQSTTFVSSGVDIWSRANLVISPHEHRVLRSSKASCSRFHMRAFISSLHRKPLAPKIDFWANCPPELSAKLRGFESTQSEVRVLECVNEFWAKIFGCKCLFMLPKLVIQWEKECVSIKPFYSPSFFIVRFGSFCRSVFSGKLILLH